MLLTIKVILIYISDFECTKSPNSTRKEKKREKQNDEKSKKKKNDKKTSSAITPKNIH